MTLLLLAVFAAAALAAAAVTPVVRRVSYRLGALDHPAERKTHGRSMPRLGGVSIGTAWAAVLIVAASSRVEPLSGWLDQTPLVPILVGGLIVFTVGVWDDIRPLSPGTKILCEVVAAAIVAGAGILIERITVFGNTMPLGWFATAATVLWIVGITNAFNLVDGLDGLATGLAIIAGTTCAAIVILRGEYPTALILVALVGALAGFLPFNFNPATIFLGDGGSLLIGFVLAVTAITGWQKGATALAVGVPILIFALPIADTLSTVFRRLRPDGAPEGRAPALARLLQPDRGHIHHHLMALGLSHRSAVLVLYGVSLCLSAMALLTMERP